MTSTELGHALSSARRIKGRSLRSVADGAKISPTYLQKLERGEVSDPSPNVLYRLSEELGLDYADLMRRAGYVVPASSRKSTAARSRSGALSHALSSEPLTNEEEIALSAYLRMLREQQGRGPGA